MQQISQPGRLPNWSRAFRKGDLEAFVQCMHGHGELVSASLMRFDRGYALQQLTLAHTLADEALQMLAMELFEQMAAQSTSL